MKVCIPVAEFRGLDSEVCAHFGSAPGFVLADTETLDVAHLPNSDHDHAHGACSPLKALAGAKPDAVVVGGIGSGALRGLRSLGIRVFRCAGGTVADAIHQLKAEQLIEMDEIAACGGHGGGHGCH
jgi:predicted Fe-Mo cluster-binding NifX family protein